MFVCVRGQKHVIRLKDVSAFFLTAEPQRSPRKTMFYAFRLISLSEIKSTHPLRSSRLEHSPVWRDRLGGDFFFFSRRLPLKALSVLICVHPCPILNSFQPKAAKKPVRVCLCMSVANPFKKAFPRKTPHPTPSPTRVPPFHWINDKLSDIMGAWNSEPKNG